MVRIGIAIIFSGIAACVTLYVSLLAALLLASQSRVANGPDWLQAALPYVPWACPSLSGVLVAWGITKRPKLAAMVGVSLLLAQLLWSRLAMPASQK